MSQSRLLRLAGSLLLLTLLLAACMPAPMSARDFAPTPFTASEFRDLSQLTTHCASPAVASFWCDDIDTVLTRIPTKGVDFVFGPAGELMAAYAKFQKGSSVPSYQSGDRDNVVAYEAAIPGATVMLDDRVVEPEGLSGGWSNGQRNEYVGAFSFLADGLEVDLRVTVSNVLQTLRYELDVRAPDGADPETLPQLVRLAFPTMEYRGNGEVKIGQANSHATNPLAVPVAAPSYISAQSRGSFGQPGNAVVLRPATGSDPMQAVALGDRRMAMQVPLVDGSASMVVEAYIGKNELVRFYQEGYADLPGLFSPNVLGRLSLWILMALVWIHGFTGTWGLAIIGLTLMFRVLIWPLISTQTRSMFGMQKLQPELQKLQKKYKDDREKLTQETMKLYREAGVNPAGGCLPIVLQMPLFIILWRVFVNFEFDEGFLWIPDLGLPDPFYILPILYVAVMLAQSWFSAKGNPTMLRQSIMINLVFVFIMVTFPAGVLLYFVVSMAVQVLQYWLLSRNQPRPAAPVKA